MVDKNVPETPDDVLAAELVLGLLEPDEKAKALRIQLSDQAFAQKIDIWNNRLDPLFQEIEPAEPSALVWEGIQSQLDHRDPSAGIQMRKWRIGALASGALAACLAIALVFSPSIFEPSIDVDQPRAVAQLTGDIEGLVLAVSYNPETAEMQVDVEGMPETETEPEIWIVGQDGVLRSLGQIGRDGISRMTIAAEHGRLIAPSTKMILTMEPQSENPHGRPSSEPVASGKITFI